MIALMWLSADTAPNPLDPSPLLNYGVLGFFAAAMFIGVLFFIRHIMKRSAEVEVENARLHKLIEEQLLPATIKNASAFEANIALIREQGEYIRRLERER